MEVKVNLAGRTLDELVETISSIMDLVPLASDSSEGTYTIGCIGISPDGTIIFPKHLGIKATRIVLFGLAENGFLEDMPDEFKENLEILKLPQYTDDAGRLIIRVPRMGFSSTSLDNLMRLISSKETLLKKAVEADTLPVEDNGVTLCFPWFKPDASSDEITAYTHLVYALCDMAKRQTRVLAIDKPVENEKYAFRCFLLRLGMIGEEYAATRRILLRNFSGNGSMKNGGRKRSAEQPPRPVPAVVHDKPRFLWGRWLKKRKRQEKQ